MYDPKGFSPYGVCRCNYYRTVFCIVYNVDSEMWLNDTHRRYFFAFPLQQWNEGVTLLRYTYIVLFYVK